MSVLTDRMKAPLEEIKAGFKAGTINTAVTYLGDREVVRDPGYSLSPEAQADYEERVARRAAELEVTGFVFATVIVIADQEDMVMMRPPKLGLPPRDFETLVVWLLAVDLDEGFEVGRVDIDLDRGKIRFGPLMSLVGEHQALPAAPGAGIMTALAKTG